MSLLYATGFTGLCYVPPVCPICARAMKYAGSSVRVRRESDGAEMPAHIACARWRAGYVLLEPAT